MMFKKVDKHSGIPAYIQIMNAVKKEIIIGRLKEGEQLPPVRELQKIFDVNVNTVLKALDRLRIEGMLEARQGVGYFVRRDVEINKQVIETVRKCVSGLKSLNVDFYTAALIFEEVWKNEA